MSAASVSSNVSIKAFVAAMALAGHGEKPTFQWLSGYSGAGDHGRKLLGEDRLAIAYDHDHVLDDLAVICTLAGIDSWRVADALEAARRASANTATQCSQFRQIIPWDDVAAGAQAFIDAGIHARM